MLKTSKLYMKGSQNNKDSLSTNQKGLLNGLFKHSLYSCIYFNQINSFKEFSIIDNSHIVQNKEKTLTKSIDKYKIKDNFDISKFMQSYSKETNYTSNSNWFKYSNHCKLDKPIDKNYKSLFKENKKNINNHFEGIIKTCKNIFDDFYEDDLLENLNKSNELELKNPLNIDHNNIKNNFLTKLFHNI